MLQQDSPDDFVIATGEQFTVRDFISWAARELGIELEFHGKGMDEVGVVKKIIDDSNNKINVGDIIIKIDSRYFRPAEVETLLGDPSKAKSELGWKPEISVREMCEEMVRYDLQVAKKNALLIKKGYEVDITSDF
jgi:GDPmannose 4,6-dehydratase